MLIFLRSLDLEASVWSCLHASLTCHQFALLLADMSSPLTGLTILYESFILHQSLCDAPLILMLPSQKGMYYLYPKMKSLFWHKKTLQRHLGQFSHTWQMSVFILIWCSVFTSVYTNFVYLYLSTVSPSICVRNKAELELIWSQFML